MKTNAVRWIALLSIVIGATLRTSAATFTSDTTISFNDSGYEGADIIVTNCTLTVEGSHSFASLQLLNGAKLTQTSSADGLRYSSVTVSNEAHVLIATNGVPLSHTNVVIAAVLVTDPSGTIAYTNDVDYVLQTDISGNTTIGRLDGSSIPDGGSVLVSYVAQELLGPTGVNLAITGDALVELGGAIDVNGLGYANGFGPGRGGTFGNTGAGAGHGGYGGMSASNLFGGVAFDSILTPTDKGGAGGYGIGPGGAGGGAIKLSVGGLLRVDGIITANGANGTNNHSGGGAGGSIWMSAATITGSGSISANGGDGEPTLGGGGGGGLIALYFNTNSYSGTVQARGGKGAVYGGAGTFYSKAVAHIVGQLLVDNGGHRGTNTLLSTTEAFDVMVKGGAVLSLTSTQTIGSLVVASNGWVSCVNQWLNVLNDAAVQSGGGIVADAASLSPGQGVGQAFAIFGYYTSGGGGYGGFGAPSKEGPLGGLSYGTILQPSNMGSSGGDVHNPLFPSGRGGGAVLITIGGTLSIEGRITAEGGRGFGQGGGGGSGGSIWITASNIVGSGTVSANGGGTDGLGGGGAGGRIAIYFQTNSFTGPITAFGGVGVNVGAAGTVYTRAQGQLGKLVVGNGGRSGTNTVLNLVEPADVICLDGAVISQAGTWNLRSLTVSSNSYVFVTNSTLTISSNASIASGGGIIAEGTGFVGGSGPGAGRTGNIGSGGGTPGVTVGSGASHGGFGGAAVVNGASLAPGNVYDSSINPITMGSGGGAGSDLAPTNAGGSGGGFIRMTVNGSLLLDGRISADGLTPANHNSGGGSGGAIILSLGSLSGSGVISASGGSGTGFGGCGGGGRIVVGYNSSTFTGTIRAYGGAGTTNSGGAGTIFRPNPATSIASIIIDNGGIAGAVTDLGNTGSTLDLTVLGRGAVWSGVNPPIRNLMIGSNSFYYSSNSTTFTISGNATVQSGGGIIADGAGSPANLGNGAGRYSGIAGGGGGYGGYGGSGLNTSAGGNPAAGGTTYGAAIQPQTLGSGGGGTTFTNFGGPGGGSLRVSVNGNLSLDGRISADGRPGTGLGGGGSGGSVWISAANFFGSGSVSANGGSASLSGGGGGGGGRIAITTSPGTNGFNGIVSAYGGSGFNRGGAGTIYTRFGVQNVGLIVVDNGGIVGTNTSITDGGSLDITIKNGGSLAHVSPSFTPRNLVINSNGWLTAFTAPMTVTGNATVQPGGGVIADALGNGPGLGQGAGRSGSSGLRGGGGYGGAGAANPPSYGTTYGNLQSPIDLGSGGGNGTSGISTPPFGGAGGGAIRLTVIGTLSVDGRVSANANPGSINSGGGSGGSLWLNVGTLNGGGVISANGGAGDPSFGGGGGGGRISLTYSTNLFTGPITAFGGNGALKGGAGTIFLKANNQGVASVVLDNGGIPGTNSGLGSSFSTSDLTLKAGALLYGNSIQQVRHLTIASNASLAFLNTFTTPFITGDLIVQPGGLITADGAGYGGGLGSGFGGTVGASGFGTTGGGGGHAGRGAPSAAGAAGGNSYDSMSAPTAGGSGGGNGSSAPLAGGSGGGIISLNVLGDISLQGTMTANGIRGLSTGSGGGAGGSIALTAHALTGSGIISANGGPGNGFGGGGGGGRIAIRCFTNSFAGLITAVGGASTPAGGAGTVYVQTNGKSIPVVVTDNGGNVGTNTPLDLSQPVVLTIQNGAVAHALTSSVTLSNLVIGPGGKFTSAPGQTNTDIAVLADATIQSGGAFSLDGLGYGATVGPGAGTNLNGIGSGAGYGGNGGASSQSQGGPAYGSASQPIDRGSGGGASSAGGSEGGGAIRLTVGGALTVDGLLSANGKPGLQDDAGGGSGGSIWLAANSLTGSGTISANGGAGELFDGGGGGGGRIALYSRSNDFTGSFTVLGGDGFLPGQDGSLFFSSNFVAPTVISQTPVGTVSNGVGSVMLLFNTPLDPASVSVSDFQLITPAGPLAQTNVNYATVVGSSSVRFDFPYQSLVGNYAFTVGPQIADLFGQTMSQVYTGAFSVLLPVVQGFVTDSNGNPVPGVVLQPSGAYSSSTTSSNGEYAIGFPPGTFVDITPIRPGLMFVPASRHYDSISGSISNENYVAVSIAPNLAAELQGTNFVMHWTGISGVTYQLYFSTNLVDWQVSSALIPGTNGPMQVPINIFSTDPIYLPLGFYRLRATN